MTTDDILDYLERQIALSEPFQDIVEVVPGISIDDSYRLMLAVARRKCAKGDRLIGYKAAYTSKAMQQANGMDEPIVGCLMQSGLADESAPIALKPQIHTIVEPEIAVLLKKDLAGPGLTWLDVANATEGVFPAIEYADWSIGGKTRSRQMGIATHKSTGGIVVGGPLSSLSGLDLRSEGAAIRLNGQPRGSGTGVEVLGNPLGVVAEIANVLSRFDTGLAAGMIVMTGSLVQAVPVSAGDAIQVDFTRLGSVNVRFA
ncbi:fumarylacetoacetate hydrolase family protein [Pigmentiphaga soli]|uniref:Fumarylacetoacetate hydrolase family protein n=1 Tax=Pigmentiphaga soli TaxID=1007095 RepID=A0ABP8HAL4_9BURK